jgi:hypothetical protein
MNDKWEMIFDYEEGGHYQEYVILGRSHWGLDSFIQSYRSPAELGRLGLSTAVRLEPGPIQYCGSAFSSFLKSRCMTMALL